MPGIRIVTDSAADIPTEEAARLGITVVPLSIRFGDEEYTDVVDLSPADFWAKCRASAALPETAAPSPGAFQEAFEAAKSSGADGVVCMNISSDLSGTYQAALAAADAMGDFPITVIDTRAVTMAQGLLVIAAAERAAAGATAEEITSSFAGELERTGVVGTLDTLEHLKKGGRVGGAAALMGSVLSIKPMLKLEDGRVAEAGRTRTRAKAIDQVASIVASEGPFAKLAVVHGAASDIDDLVGKLTDVECDSPIIVGDIGSVVGTHGGPGIIGVCWVKRA